MIKRLSEPEDYCLVGTAPENRLSQFERLTLVGGDELSRAIAWITKQLASFSYSRAVASVDFGRLIERGQFYLKPEWQKDPSLFFTRPIKAPDVSETIVHGLKDGQIIDLKFASSYEVKNSALKAEYEQHVANATVHARWWRHTKEAKATIIALHGWTMGDQRLNSLAFLPGFFYQEGYNVVLLELPFHGRRSKGSKASDAEQFPDSDPALTNEAMGQVISDLRNLKLFLEANGASNIGCIGMSLGGYCASLWAGLDKLAFCIPIVPLVSMSELAWKILVSRWGKEALKTHGVSARFLNKVYSIHTPLSHRTTLSPKKLLIISGRGDKMVPARQSRLLWHHWKQPTFLRLRGGHAAQLGGMHVFSELLSFLSKV